MSEAAWAKAFVEAQAEMPEVTKAKEVTVRTNNGQTFSYSYADLPAILLAVRPHLAKHGLGVSQNVETVDGNIVVYTTIYHCEGHGEAFGPIKFPAGNNPQAAGSAITYARRYALCAALNIAADDDDDGQVAKNSAGSDPVPAKARGSNPQAAPAAVSPPKHSGEGVTHAGDQTPVETQAAAQSATPSPDQSQGQGVAPDNKDLDVEHRDSVPSGSEAWSVIQEAVSSGRVKKTSVHIHAATLCTGREGMAVPAKFEDLKDCPPEILAEVAEHFGLGVAA